MSAKRLGVEALVVVVLALGSAGIWWWKDREAAARERQWETRVDQLRQEAGKWAAELASGEAKAVFGSFAAGIAPPVLAERTESVDQAVVGLLELPAVVFVHVVAPDGTVIASSDRKLMTAGQVGEAARWALATEDIENRASERAGVLEVAAPIVGPAGAKAFLWLGYDVSARVETTRPSGWGGNTGSAPSPLGEPPNGG